MKMYKGLHRVIGLMAAIWLMSIVSVMAQVGPSALLECRDFAFSTEEDFIAQEMVPPDDNPIISDGDLLGPNCAVCARNADLLYPFDISPQCDLGLDAVHVVDVKAYLVAFSTELDSPNQYQFTAGDLLITNGAIIPNVALMYKNGYTQPDMGLDGVQLVGKPEDIITFVNFAATQSRTDWLNDPGFLSMVLERYKVDILFSVEGTGPIPERFGFLDGDLLSAATGLVVARNSDLLPNSVPAGIPQRGVDFGLDAVNLFPEGFELNLFSTELLFYKEPVFTDGDILRMGNGVVIHYPNLVRCFRPRADFLGLDALYRSISISDVQQLRGLIAAAGYLESPRLPVPPSTGGTTEASLQLDRCAELAFSTEEEFMAGRVPPDGNPIISDGDLLSPDGEVCARNRDLVGVLDVEQDLGLDAVDVIFGRGRKVVAFSTELDSPHNGTISTHFTSGDLLATNGARIPNIALTYLFKIGYDIGLDGIHFIGENEQIIYLLDEAFNLGRDFFIANPFAFMNMLNQYDVDLWFSTEGTAPNPYSPGFLDGDVLSARYGSFVLHNSDLLPNSVPAGIPYRGVDFGLDVVTGGREP